MHTLLDAHSDNIFAVAWSPTGEFLASAGRDSKVHLWHFTSGRLQYTYHEPSTTCFLSLAWSPDGRYLAAGSTTGPVFLWDVATGSDKPQLIYRGHRRFARCLAWSPDGRYLASGGDFGDNTVQVWSATSGKLLTTYTAQYRIFSLGWSQDGVYLASASFDGSVHVWSTQDGVPVFIYRGHSGPVYALDWSPVHGYLASAGEDAEVHIWSVPGIGHQPALAPAIIEPRVLPMHTRPIKTLAWSPGGERLASAGEDKLVNVYEPFATEPGATLHTFTEHRAWIRALAWSPDGTCLASASASDIYLTQCL
ncbi:hypothetical protein KSD_29550 [Ktedonobacter sp. SOSP1-85]|uniref:WD40 repeat domain-containing protein n=1 Tax=Ktedonobacter sp. SOSP1-85 TaxID=2778367 RepID=UPI00191649F2|nr:WD40 repeat domain-containing protein [Ktedonobacter sp. SOSP1-85]GHO75184.1 hypothetical protein KSD_29550 [Ktedonobacter sp. SOSP1-85]